MRLTSITLHSSYDDEDLEFSVKEGSFINRYIVRSIVGIDAEEIVPKFYGFGEDSGSPFYEFIMKPRDIVMRVALNPRYQDNEDVSDIRDEIYKRISRNRTGQLTLQFFSGAVLVKQITGMITKMEVGYFSQLPELQITFTCPDPVFRAPNPIVYSGADLGTTNPIIMPDSASTAPHGMTMTIEFTDTSPSFRIWDQVGTNDWEFAIVPASSFVAGDILQISSERGNKYVYREDTPDVNLMDKMESDSVWPVIFPGTNSFHFLNLTTGYDIVQVSYYSAFWGV